MSERKVYIICLVISAIVMYFGFLVWTTYILPEINATANVFADYIVSGL